MQVFTDITDPTLCRLLQDGAVGVLPTDTIYGLVCSVTYESAVHRLFTIKHREDKPGTILAANEQQLRDMGFADQLVQRASQYWPNQISVIIPCGKELAYLHMGLDSLAVRIPKHPALLGLLAQTGPLMTTSANHPSEPTATSIDSAKRYFGDAVDFYVDAGELGQRPPSTIIRFTAGGGVAVIREGVCKINEKGEVVSL